MGAIDTLLQPSRHRITVADYHRMAEAGVLAPDARVELIDGEVIDMPPQKTRHAYVVTELMTRLVEAVARKARVTCQTPLRLSDRSEPEPDLMLLRPRADAYRDATPTPADVLLLVEVGDATARFDQQVKLPLYAQAGVAEVWLLDLQAGRVRLHRHPQAGEYADITSTDAPASVPLPSLDGLSVDLSGLLR